MAIISWPWTLWLHFTLYVSMCVCVHRAVAYTRPCCSSSFTTCVYYWKMYSMSKQTKKRKIKHFLRRIYAMHAVGVYIGTTWRIWLNDHRAAMKQLVWNYFDHSLFIVFSSIPVGRQIGNRFCVDKRHVAGYRSRLIKIPSAGEKQRMHTCKKRDCGTLREWSGVGGTYVCGTAAV